MLKILLPLAMMLAGLGAGLGAAVVLRPDISAPPAVAPAEPDAKAGSDPPPASAGEAPGQAGAKDGETREYVELKNPFVVPLVRADRLASLVILSIGLEMRPGDVGAIYSQEPKLRDVLLQVLFDHANMGGFDGAFTDGAMMDALRGALRDAAQGVAGTAVTGILITNVARQDV